MSVACYIYKASRLMQNISTVSLPFPWQLYFPNHQSQTWNKHDPILHMYQAGSDIDKFSFAQPSIPEFNRLPANTVQAECPANFKGLLIRHLMASPTLSSFIPFSLFFFYSGKHKTLLLPMSLNKWTKKTDLSNIKFKFKFKFKFIHVSNKTLQINYKHFK